METVITHRDIYIDVRNYLISLLEAEPKQVIQGYQNNSPLPLDAIVMAITSESEIDTPATYTDEENGKLIVQQSREVVVQVDFFGKKAQERCQKVSIIWKNYYTTEALKCCQPLYAREPRRLPILNEQAMYEDRWTIELVLQYNPEVAHEQIYLGMPEISIHKL